MNQPNSAFNPRWYDAIPGVGLVTYPIRGIYNMIAHAEEIAQKNGLQRDKDFANFCLVGLYQSSIGLGSLALMQGLESLLR